MTACLRYPSGIGERTKGGYVRLPLGEQQYDARGWKKGRRKVLLHRWVVERVDGPLPPWPASVVMHSCDTPDCFLYEHLRAATYADNNRDCREKGRHVALSGEQHGNTRITEADVTEIRRLRASGATFASIAEQFPVCITTVRNIVAGRTWKHVEE